MYRYPISSHLTEVDLKQWKLDLDVGKEVRSHLTEVDLKLRSVMKKCKGRYLFPSNRSGFETNLWFDLWVSQF